MKKYFYIFIIMIFITGCVKDETLIDQVIGEYSGYFNKNNHDKPDYLLDVSKDMNDLIIAPANDSEFPVLKITPIVKNSTEIVSQSNKEDKIQYSILFIFRGSRISLSMVIYDIENRDTITYGGIKR